ncbi:MAG: hypothetical protein K8T91_09895 [Planctomycetes bacterium]|nr:hypothetical protein [Planctomycetota bacterium]
MLRTALLILLTLIGLGYLMPTSMATAAEDAPAAATGPVTIEDIRALRRERSNFKQIMDHIEQRGLGFVIDDATERKLRSIGFTLKMVAQLKGMQAAPQAPAVAGGEPAAADPGAPPAKHDPPAGKPVGVRRVLDAATEQEYASTAERLKRLVAESNTAVTAHPTPHMTLFANPRVAARALPDLVQVQKLIAERFPDPIAGGVDPRGANIALLESRYEYENWMKALVKIHQAAGLKFQSQDPLKAMLSTDSVFVPGLFSVCLQGMDAEAIRRRLAFSVGYQYMEQLTNNKGPDALRTGFGNLTEVMMFREPTMTVLSGYTDRRLGANRARWVDLVRQRFGERRPVSVTDTLHFTTGAMTLDHYAEAWSLAEFLASEPRNFSELVVELEKGTDAATAIEKIYGLKEEALLKRWTMFVQGKR